MTAAGSYLYLLFWPNTPQIVNVADPANPVDMGSYQSVYAEEFSSVLVDGNYAYVSGNPCNDPGCGSGTLAVVDISNPAEPAEVVTVAIGSDDLRELVISGDYAYLAAGWAGMQIVDLNPLPDAALVSSFGTYYEGRGIEITADHHAYVRETQCFEQYSCSGAVQIFNVADPAVPSEINFFKIGYSASYLDVAGNYAYLVTNERHEGQLNIIDVTNPAEVVFLANWIPEQPFPPGSMYGVAASGDYAYVSTGPIYKVNMSNPAEPVEEAVYSPPIFSPELVIHDERLYGLGYGGDGLLILSLDSFQQIGFYDIQATVVDLFANDQYAYVNSSAGLTILDVSNPAEPIEIGFYETGNALNVTVVGNYAYLADWFGLHVLDVSDPAEPVEVAVYSTGGATVDVTFDGSHLYVLDAFSGLFVYKLLGLDHQFYLPLAAQ